MFSVFPSNVLWLLYLEFTDERMTLLVPGVAANLTDANCKMAAIHRPNKASETIRGQWNEMDGQHVFAVAADGYRRKLNKPHSSC